MLVFKRRENKLYVYIYMNIFILVEKKLCKEYAIGRGYLEVHKDYLLFIYTFALFKLVLLLFLKI